MQLVVLGHDTCQLSIATHDQFELLEAISQLLIFLDVVLKHLLNLEPLFFFCLHEELLSVKLLLELSRFLLERLAFFLGSG